MKTQTDIEDRVRFLLCEELSRRVREAETRLPHLCQHNHRQPLDTRKSVEDQPNETFNRTSDHRGLPVLQTIGLCMLGAEKPEEWQGNICEDPIDAQRCPYFLPAATKASLYESFQDNVLDLEWVRFQLPEVYGLLWALESESKIAMPWWKRLWFRWLRIRVQPVQSAASVIPFLPPGGPV